MRETVREMPAKGKERGKKGKGKPPVDLRGLRRAGAHVRD
jgi:hypothetical protein